MREPLESLGQRTRTVWEAIADNGEPGVGNESPDMDED